MATDDGNENNNRKRVITVIHCWSAPRSRSTAVLYSFEARGTDRCVAIDEPLYREWVIHLGDKVERPYREELIEGRPPADRQIDASEEEIACWKRELLSLKERIIKAAHQLLANAKEGPKSETKSLLPDDGGSDDDEGDDDLVIFCKHMAKHSFLYDFENELQSDLPELVELRHRHLLLIRDPFAVLSSWTDRGSVHGNEEAGILQLLEIYSSLDSRRNNNNNGNDGDDDEGNRSGDSTSAGVVVVLDSDELAANPTSVLKTTCQRLGISYTNKMMSWSSGPHACDGPWARWWYMAVHKSTGWERRKQNTTTTTAFSSNYTSKYRTLDPCFYPALQASLPAYQFLQTLSAGYQQRGLLNNIKYQDDPRNARLLVWVGAPSRGRLVPRDMANISALDSAIQGQGDDIAWEYLRVHKGKILLLEKHLLRLFESATTLGFYNDNNNNVHNKEEVTEALFRTLAANGMRDGAHARLTLTRGEICTSNSMKHASNVYGTTLIILAEWSMPVARSADATCNIASGAKLISASQRRNSPTRTDRKSSHRNLIDNALPKSRTCQAGAQDAVMLDFEGYVLGTSAANIFILNDDGVLMTPSAAHHTPGITCLTVLELAEELDVSTVQKRVSLAELYAADEVFTMDTVGELTPVIEIDGHIIGDGKIGGTTAKLYLALSDRPKWATDIPPFEMQLKVANIT